MSHIPPGWVPGPFAGFQRWQPHDPYEGLDPGERVKERELVAAIRQTDWPAMKRLILDPEVDLMWTWKTENPGFLYLLVERDHRAGVSLMLRQRRLVNPKVTMFIPCNVAVSLNKPIPFLLLLEDQARRWPESKEMKIKCADLDVDASFEYSTMYTVIISNSVLMLLIWMASDQPLTITKAHVDLALTRNRPNMVAALEKAMNMTRRQMQLAARRERPELVGWMVARMYTLIVLVSDEYYNIRSSKSCCQKHVRFFRIAVRLPIELQLVLVRRLYDSSGISVNKNDVETHFHHWCALDIDPANADPDNADPLPRPSYYQQIVSLFQSLWK